MTKFSEWIKTNDKKQRGVAEKLGIGTATLHEILRKGHIPSIKVAYAIELYTHGAITLYDWIDQKKDTTKVSKIKTKEKRIST